MPALFIIAALAAAVVPRKVADQMPPMIPVVSFEARILSAHNQERQRVGVKPLVWSSKLAADAAIWARHLAATDTFDHAPDRSEGDEQGENLWMGTRGYYTPEAMVGAWVEERKMFKPGLFPNVSITGNWTDVGHYSQLIWYNTTAVGCARAANRSDEFLVCRYGPPGNWMGESALGRSPAPVKPPAKAKNRP
jgi:Cysteine-rich secretory protein family